MNLKLPKLKRSHLKQTVFSKVKLIAFIAIFAIIGGYILLKSNATGPNIWISTTGNDSSCIRGDQTKPCLTFNKAYQIAQANDLVSVAGGSYGDVILGTNADTKAVTFQGVSNTTVIFNTLDLEASNVTMDNFAYNRTATSGPENALSIGGNNDTITHSNVDAGHQVGQVHGGIFVAGTNSNFQNGSVHNALDDKDVQIASGADHTTFDKWDFYDVHATSSAIHAECIYNQSNYLTITNSQFWNCYTMDLSFTTCCGNPPAGTGMTLKNNVFQSPINSDPEGPTLSGYAVNFNSSTLGTLTNWTVENNTFDGPVSDSGSVSGSFVWANNIGADWGCLTGATYSHNVGKICGASDKSAATFGWVNNPPVPGKGDYHLTAASPAINAGISAYAPSLDKDGITRANPPEAGAYEYIPSSNVWVSPTGSDTTCARSDQTKPCASFQKACTLAQPGDIISVANGNYSHQTVTCIQTSPGVTFQAATPHGVDLTGLDIGTSNSRSAWLSFDGIDVGDFAAQGNTSTQQRTSHITINHMKVTAHTETGSSPVVYIANVDNLLWQNSELGPICCNQDGIDLYGSQPGNDFITFNHLDVHDVVGGDSSYNDNLKGCDVIPSNLWPNCRTSATAFAGNHVDCLQVLSAGNLTISNSRFVNCWNAGNLQNGILNGSQDWNWTISNSVFEGGGTIGEYETEMRSGGSGCCAFPANDPDSGNTNYIRLYNNTFVGGIVMDSTTAAAPLELTAVGNIFGSHLSGCSDAGFNWTRFDYNLVTTNNLKTCYATSVVGNPIYTNISPTPTAVVDMHLKSGSPGIDIVPNGTNGALTIDYDGITRPQGSAIDAGAYEYVSSSCPQGDINGDCHVTITDLSILLSHYGQSATANQGDINNDGICNIVDLSILLSHYGT